MPKPGDFFLGLYEFFSILVPGALLLIVFIVLLQDQYVAFNVPTAANWAVFLLLSYLTGHLLQIPADLIDKIVYDRFYVKRKRRQPDRLFNRAKCVVARSGRNEYDENTYNWAYATLKIANNEAILEIDRLQAGAKLFRSLAVVSFLTAITAFVTQGSSLILLLFLVLTGFSLWRYCRLRWKAVCDLYRYFILLAEADPVSDKLVQFWKEPPAKMTYRVEAWTKRSHQ